MGELHIERLEGRYHLPPSRQGDKARLDRLLAAAAGEALATGLEHLGLTGDGELCIRELHLPLRLQLGQPDAALILAWSDAMAAGVLAALRQGDGEWVVRFASRREALAAFAAAVATGDARQGWAFRQLGLWQEGEEPAEALARALAAEPAALVPVLVAVAEAGALAALARQFELGWWPQLAALALTSVGWRSFSFSLGLGAAGGGAVAQGSEHGVAAGSPATLEWAAFWAELERLELTGSLPERERRALAALPGPRLAALAALLQPLGSEEGRAMTGLAVALPELRSSRLAPLFTILAVEPISPLGQALAALVWLELDPGRLRATAVEGRSQLLAATAMLLAPTEGLAPLAPPAAVSPQQMVPQVQRRLGLTEWGGLLFLVGVADDLGLPDEVAAHAVLGQRPGRWVWHQLALELVPVTAEDPAALAFAGLLPGNESPSFAAESANEHEQQALAALAERVLREAAARLQVTKRAEDRPRAALVDFLCRRQARVLADPGWIEIHFSLDDVDTTIRRARLDLDPGFVPWLGVVLRFIYE